MRRRTSHRRVADIEIAGQRNEKTLTKKFKSGPLALVDNMANLVAAIGRKADLHNWRRTLLSGVDANGVVAIQQNHAFGWRDIQKAAKAGLDLLKVAVDVSMVELDVINNDELGQVVDKFRALVEEGGVVFVAFNDEILRVPQTGALSKVRWNASNQVSWGETGRFKYPGQNRGRRGFAVCAGDNQIVSATENEVAKRLRHR